MALTDLAKKRVVPVQRSWIVKLSDGDGLQLRITPDGAKRWHMPIALADRRRPSRWAEFALVAGRTKSTLAAAKAKGVKLGNPRIEAARSAAVARVKAEADRAANNALPIIAEIRKFGAMTFRAIADALNARGVPTTPLGGRWMNQRKERAGSSVNRLRAGRPVLGREQNGASLAEASAAATAFTSVSGSSSMQALQYHEQRRHEFFFAKALVECRHDALVADHRAERRHSAARPTEVQSGARRHANYDSRGPS